MKKALLVLVAFALVVSGCIDLEERVTIHKDGSGTIMLTAFSTEQMAMEGLKKEKLLEVDGLQVKAKNTLKQKKFYHHEWIDFKSISEFSIKGEILGLHVTKAGLMGFGKKMATFNHAIVAEKPSEPLSQAMLADHYFNYVLELPGKIKKAYPLQMGDVEVEPSIEKNIITWNIPLTMFMDTAGKPIMVRVDFEGKFKITGDLYSQHGIEKLLAKDKIDSALATYDALVEIRGEDDLNLSGKIYLEIIKEALKDKDTKVRMNAASALGEIGDKSAIPLLKEALKDKDTVVRMSAASALEMIGDKSAIPLLKEALKDKSESVKIYAAMALYRIGDKSAIPLLKESLKDKDMKARMYAAMALGKIGDKSAIPLLKEALKDKDTVVRMYAARALGEIGDKSAIPLLKEALKDKNVSVRVWASSALGKIGDKSAIPLLKEALKNKDTGIRMYAASALGEIGDKSAISLLKEALKDKNSRITVNAVRSLMKISKIRKAK